jgi:hypothetical protein
MSLRAWGEVRKQLHESRVFTRRALWTLRPQVRAFRTYSSWNVEAVRYREIGMSRIECKIDCTSQDSFFNENFSIFYRLCIRMWGFKEATAGSFPVHKQESPFKFMYFFINERDWCTYFICYGKALQTRPLLNNNTKQWSNWETVFSTRSVR